MSEVRLSTLPSRLTIRNRADLSGIGSLTRFGEISPLWQKFMLLGKFSLLQIAE